MGEVQAASPLIDACLGRWGAGRVAVTTMTATGSALVQRRWGDRLVHAYLPFDLPFCLRPLLDRWQPRRCVVMESELWPNLFRALHRRQVPLLLANARMSPRSLRRYRRLGSWFGRTLQCVTGVAAQSEHDAHHYREFGAPQVRMLGNLKFDCPLPPEAVAAGQAWRRRLGTDRPVWIAASTHRDEDGWALQAHRTLLETQPDAALILVPRHPQRFGPAWEQIRTSGLRRARRSNGDFDGQTQVLLGDSMGEMWAYLAAADVAFVGGSLAPVGGHNVLEPAALARPVLFGPCMHNFLPARALLMEAEAAIELQGPKALAPRLAELLSDPTAAQAMGQRARRAREGHQGATRRVMQWLETL